MINDNSIVCQLCNKEVVSHKCLTQHIHKHHDISIKEYYDMFLKRENEEICPTCNGKNKFLSLGKGYTKYCCTVCSNRNKDKQRKGEETCLRHFGVRHPAQSDIIKETLKKKNLTKYGVEYVQQTAEYKNKMKDHYKQRWIDNHDKYIQKSKETCMYKYGVDSSNKSEVVKQKQTATLFEHYKITNPGQHNTIIDSKRKQTNIKRYGVEHPSQSEYVKQKHIITSLEKYGVYHPMQTREVLLKTKKKFTKNGKHYDSSWEYYYEQWLITNNIRFEYHPNIFYWYEYKGKLHRYFPDFVIYDGDDNKEVIDIKGDHLKKSMLNPTTKEHQKYLCMIKNNVKLLFKRDLKELGIL